MKKRMKSFNETKYFVEFWVYLTLQKNSFKISPEGTPFLQKIWALLSEIKPGKTLTYLEIARRFGNKKAIRAVGSAIGKNPKIEQNYIDLMMLFSIGNQEEKAFEIAKKLAEEIPNSDWAHVSLFKFYLDKNENENAITSMFKVLQNKKIDDRIKHRILNEFLIVTINTNNYDKELEKAVSYFDDDKNINISKEMGKFFYNKKDLSKTIFYLKVDKKLKHYVFDKLIILINFNLKLL